MGGTRTRRPICLSHFYGIFYHHRADRSTTELHLSVNNYTSEFILVNEIFNFLHLFLTALSETPKDLPIEVSGSFWTCIISNNFSPLTSNFFVTVWRWQLTHFDPNPAYSFEQIGHMCVFLEFLPPNVLVWLWQFGHKNLKFSKRLSLLIPFLWSNWRTILTFCHMSRIPHWHLYSIKLPSRILRFTKPRSSLLFSTKINSSFFREHVPLILRCIFLFSETFDTSKESSFTLRERVLWLPVFGSNFRYLKTSEYELDLSKIPWISDFSNFQIMLVFRVELILVNKY